MWEYYVLDHLYHMIEISNRADEGHSDANVIVATNAVGFKLAIVCEFIKTRRIAYSVVIEACQHFPYTAYLCS